jgi:hypothetical protein
MAIEHEPTDIKLYEAVNYLLLMEYNREFKPSNPLMTPIVHLTFDEWLEKNNFLDRMR